MRVIGLCCAALAIAGAPAVQAAHGYWLDQYNALLYLASFQLDRELEQMQRQGAGVVMVHADSLPDPLLRWIAWRARRAQLQPVAWIHGRLWPTCAGLVP